VAALWQLAQRNQVVHARGTPNCGKSVLAGLLKSHVELVAPNVKVYLFDWIPSRLEKNQLDEYSQFYELLDCLTRQPKPLGSNWLNQANTLVMIDEAQLSYAYMDLWNKFIKPLSGAGYGPFLILFSSYGSATDSPIPADPLKMPTPVEFNDEQRVSLRPLFRNNPGISLFFTHEEFVDAVNRTCEPDSNRQPFIPSLELREYIWELCSGHPGVTVSVVKALIRAEVSLLIYVSRFELTFYFRIRN
jgi:hypothetical protein